MTNCLLFRVDMLWKAPEILRSPSLNGKGTQLGDVYSFAIILQEMHTRKGPYSHNFEETKGKLYWDICVEKETTEL